MLPEGLSPQLCPLELCLSRAERNSGGSLELRVDWEDVTQASLHLRIRHIGAVLAAESFPITEVTRQELNVATPIELQELELSIPL